MLDKLLLRASAPTFTRQHVQGADDKVGICLSGGGIRSASYCLGALQALRVHSDVPGGPSVLARAKELMAVSGGAYIAAAHAVSATQASPPGGVRDGAASTPAVKADLETRPAWSRGSPEELYLRNNSSYIAPNVTQKIRASSIWFRGLVLNIACIAFVVVALGSLVGWALYGLHSGLRAEGSVCVDAGEHPSDIVPT